MGYKTRVAPSIHESVMCPNSVEWCVCLASGRARPSRLFAVFRIIAIFRGQHVGREKEGTHDSRCGK